MQRLTLLFVYSFVIIKGIMGQESGTPGTSPIVVSGFEIERTSMSQLAHYRGMNPRAAHPIGIHLNFGGVELLGGSLDYFIRPDLDIEAGAGLNGASLGSHYHFTGLRAIPWTIYAGAHFTYYYNGLMGIYIPGGLQMLQYHGLSFRFEMALWLRQYKPETEILNEAVLWGRLAFGYYF